MYVQLKQYYKTIHNNLKNCYIQINLPSITFLKIILIYLHRNNMPFELNNYKKLHTYFHYEKFEQTI